MFRWQTETGWPVTAPCLGMQNDGSSEDGQPHIKEGSVARPVPGWDVRLLTGAHVKDDEHHSYRDQIGDQDAELVVKLPLPPGTTSQLC